MKKHYLYTRQHRHRLVPRQTLQHRRRHHRQQQQDNQQKK
jgi:hypothetical protein